MPEGVKLGTIYTELELRTQKMTAGVRDAINQTHKLHREVKASAEQTNTEIAKSAERTTQHFHRMMQQQAADVTRFSRNASIALIGMGGAALTVATRMDSLNRGLRATMGSAAAADREMRKLIEAAKSPGLSLREAVQGSIRLQAVGMSADQARRSMQAFGNALATVGGTKDDLREVTLQLTQMLGSGKLQGDELRIIAERVPQVRAALKAAFGTASSEEINKFGVTAERVMAKVVEHLEKLPSAGDSAQNTFINLQDVAERALAAIGETFLPQVAHRAQQLAEKLQGLVEWFKALPEPAKQAFGDAGILTVGLTGAVYLAGSFLEKLGAVSGALRGIVASPAFRALLKLGIIGGGAAAVGRAVETQLDAAMTGSVGRGTTGVMPVTGPFGMFGSNAEMELAQRELREQVRAERITEQNKLSSLMRLGRGDLEEQRALRMPRPVPPALTIEGRYAALNQRIDKLNAQRTALFDKIKSAASNAEKNLLGREILKINRELFNAENALQSYDPRAQARLGRRAQSAAARAAQKAAKAAAERQQALLGIEIAGRENDWFGSMAREEAQRISEYNAFAAAGLRSDREEDEGRYFDTLNQQLDTLAPIRRAEEMAGAVMHTIGNLGQTIGRAQSKMQAESLEKQRAAAQEMLKTVGDAASGVVEAFGKVPATIAENMRAQREAVLDAWGGLGRNLADEFAAEFAGTLGRLFGNNPIGRALSRSLNRVLQGVFDNLFANLFQGIGGASDLTGGGITGKGFGKGGIAGSGISPGILSPIGALAGFFAGGPIGGLIGGLAGSIVGGLGSVFGFAGGGFPPVGRWSLVGERGPELIRPMTPVQVAPLGAGGANVTINVTAAPGMDIRSLSREIAWQVQHQMRAR